MLELDAISLAADYRRSDGVAHRDNCRFGRISFRATPESDGASGGKCSPSFRLMHDRTRGMGDNHLTGRRSRPICAIMKLMRWQSRPSRDLPWSIPSSMPVGRCNHNILLSNALWLWPIQSDNGLLLTRP